MKKAIFCIVALLFAEISVFAFKPVARKNTKTFYLEIGANKFDPSKYTTSGRVKCEGVGTVYSVIVEDKDIYSYGPNVGKPKVDDPYTQAYKNVSELTPGIVTQTTPI